MLLARQLQESMPEAVNVATAETQLSLGDWANLLGGVSIPSFNRQAKLLETGL
jgi:hypothetical protein